MKRRPLWSKLRSTAAALFCGLLALSFSASVWAGAAKQTSKVSQSSKQKKVSQASSSGKAKVSSKAKTSGKAKEAGKARTSSKKPGKAPPVSEIGQAEIAESGTIGLHGLASFYGHGFQGRKTATGELFDVKNFTAASNRFPLGAKVAVRRIDNDRCAIVKVNDRMHAKHRRRIIDVSRGVAEYLGMISAGVVMVRVAALKDDQAANHQVVCQSAFEPELPCVDCGRPLLDPDI